MKECNSIKLRHSDIVADIGAYVGTYAIRCARYPVKQVIAYEPTKRTYDVLNLTKLPNLNAINAAVVGDDRDVVELFISKGIGVTNSIVPSRAKPNTVQVPAISYIKAVKGTSIVKIDIEGGEYDIPVDLFVQPSVRAFIIDFHAVGKDWINKAQAIIDNITQAGFETVIQPVWSNGWTRAGSWQRPMDTFGEYEPMMQGKECCGCGTLINGVGKSICTDCVLGWSRKHREGYAVVERLAR